MTDTSQWAVLPVKFGGKVPIVADWRNESRPRDQWGEKWPSGDVNTGIDCGKSGLVVIDEDEPGAFERHFGFVPSTYTVTTGKGKHYYFRHDRDEFINRPGFAPGLDVRAHGSQVLAAGSTHETGAVYGLERDVEPIPLPEEIMSRLPRRDRHSNEVELDLSRASFVLPETIPNGSRNDTLFRYASSLVSRNVHDDEALVLLGDAFERCAPPYTETTPEQMWTRVRREYGGDRKFLQDVEREVHRLRVREQALTEFTESQAAESAYAWFGETGDTFDPGTPEPVACVLEYAPARHVFAPGINIVFGDRASIKTWLCYVGVTQEVSKGSRAAIIDYEMSFKESMRRLYELGVTPETAQRVVYIQPPGPISDAARALILSRFEDTPPSLVVIDSIGMGMGMAGLDSNSDKDATIWALDLPMWMKAQWPEAVIVLIDHVPKAQGKSRDPIGSQRKGAFADALFNTEIISPISRQRRGMGRLTVTKDRKGLHDVDRAILDYEFGGGGPFQLRPTDPGVVAVDLTSASDPVEQQRCVAAYVGDYEGVKVEAARDALKIRAAEFTVIKDALVRDQVIEHRHRHGLFKGNRWDEFMEGVGADASTVSDE